jgi:hypothetical protein
MLWAAPTKADTLDITASVNGGPEYTWINVPIGYGLRQGDFHAGLGTYLDPNADGPTRAFWLNDLAGESLHVVVTDDGIYWECCCWRAGANGGLHDAPSPSVTCTAKSSASPRLQALENLPSSARDAPRRM